MLMTLVLAQLLPLFAHEDLSIQGKVQFSEKCLGKKDEAMVWLSKDHSEYKKKTLLLHTMVPKGGDFSFFVKPGDYLIRVTNKTGCLLEKNVTVDKKIVMLDLKLEK